jgi:hypothetical protein
MSENFDELLSGLAAAAAGATSPQGPAAARRRGKQRVTRRRVTASVLSAALVVGAAGAALAARGPSGVPAPVTHSGSPRPNPSADATATAPSPSASSATPADGAPTLSLTLPASLAQGTRNPVGLAVTNPGPAKTATVTVDLGRPSTYVPDSRTPADKAVLERQDPGGGGAWVAVPVTLSGAFHDVATYQLDLPAHATANETLRVIPAGGVGATISVRLSVSGFAAVTRSATRPLVSPTITATGPTSVTPGTTSGEFDFTVTNATLGDYTGIHLYLDAYGSTAVCTTLVFPTAQWSDGGSWHTVSLSEQWPLFDTIALSHGHSAVIRVRLAVPATLDPCLKEGQAALIAQNLVGDAPALGDSNPGLVPLFSVRGDAPFFQIK